MDRVWRDSTGRRIEVGHVVSKAYRTGSSIFMQVGIIRSFEASFIRVELWDAWKKAFVSAIIRQPYQATITGMTEEEFMNLVNPGPTPLADAEAQGVVVAYDLSTS